MEQVTRTGNNIGIYIPFADEEAAAKAYEAITKIKGCKGATPVGIESLGLKKLPRDEETGQISRIFYARGNKYTILSGQEGIGIKRATIFQQALIQMGFARNYQALIDYITEGLRIANGPIKDLGELRTQVNQHFFPLTTAIVEHSKEQYDIAFWLCTLFVIRDGEDVTKWVEAEQKEKIDDWAAEYSEIDFFLLAGSSDDSFWKGYQVAKKIVDTRQTKLEAAGLGS